MNGKIFVLAGLFLFVTGFFLFVLGYVGYAITIDEYNRVSTPCKDLKKCQVLPLEPPDKFGRCEKQTMEYAGLWHDSMTIKTAEDCTRTAYPN